MKKKKLKKLLKAARAKLAKRRKPKAKKINPPAEALALMQKVKGQLEDLHKPIEAQRRDFTSWNPTVAEYVAMDPYYLSTMQVHESLRS
jgi:hypothetical protein